MSIAFGGIVAFAFRGVNLLASLGLLILCSNQLTKDELGTFVLGLTVVGVVNASTGGLTAATGFQISSKRKLPGTALSSGGIVGIAPGVAAILAGFAVGSFFAGGSQREPIAVGFACAAVILSSVLAGTFLGREAFVRYNLALILPPLCSLSLISIAFFGFGGTSPDVALEMYALGQWLAIVLLVIGSAKVITVGLGAQRTVVKEIVRFALIAGVASGISYLNYRADLFIVDHFKGKEAVGTYSLAVYLAESIWQVSGSLTLATYARLGGSTRHEAVQLTTRVMRHTLLLLAGLCIVLFASADVIQNLLFPKQDGMAMALRILLPGVLLYSLAQSYSGFYTWHRGMPWVSAVVAGTGLTIDVILALILVPRMGVNGAALASAVAYGTAIVGGLVVFVRTEHLSAFQVFRFGRQDVEDYRTLLVRVRGRLS